MDYTTRSPNLQRFTRTEGQWLSFKLKAAGITHAEVANAAGVSETFVTMVLNGKRSSIHVYSVLCAKLDFSSLAELMAEATRGVA